MSKRASWFPVPSRWQRAAGPGGQGRLLGGGGTAAGATSAGRGSGGQREQHVQRPRGRTEPGASAGPPAPSGVSERGAGRRRRGAPGPRAGPCGPREDLGFIQGAPGRPRGPSAGAGLPRLPTLVPLPVCGCHPLPPPLGARRWSGGSRGAQSPQPPGLRPPGRRPLCPHLRHRGAGQSAANHGMFPRAPGPGMSAGRGAGRGAPRKGSGRRSEPGQGVGRAGGTNAPT